MPTIPGLVSVLGFPGGVVGLNRPRHSLRLSVSRPCPLLSSGDLHQFEASATTTIAIRVVGTIRWVTQDWSGA
jgi:hypothetical protein